MVYSYYNKLCNLSCKIKYILIKINIFLSLQQFAHLIKTALPTRKNVFILIGNVTNAYVKMVIQEIHKINVLNYLVLAVVVFA